MRNVPASRPGLTFHDVVYRPSVALGTARADAAPPWRYRIRQNSDDDLARTVHLW